ncbi:hypothetical protein [Deinococcus phoenicis]|uniref:hypothetical protein n=1 Tax=Deinococcus phoenicis TaxID=1476583 RepID=UPI000553BE73|nr:hypothetical protein [Deinococcus phoenicis]
MSGQVLDVGDCVIHRMTRSPGVIVGVEAVLGGSSYTVDWTRTASRERYSRFGWSGSELSREGGDLQPGDWVRVTGRCEQGSTTDVDELLDALGLIVDDFSEEGAPDFLVFVLGEQRTYECSVHQLIRITRVEALS